MIPIEYIDEDGCLRLEFDTPRETERMPYESWVFNRDEDVPVVD